MLSEKIKEKPSEHADQITSSDDVLGFSAENQIKGNLKDQSSFHPAKLHSNSTEDNTPGKRDVHNKSKSKDVIKTVEKIIQQSSVANNSESSNKVIEKL